MHGAVLVPKPANEPVLSYAPKSPEKSELAAKLAELKSQRADIPNTIGSKEVRTGNLIACRPPHDHRAELGRYHQAGAKQVREAALAAQKASKDWAAMPWEARAAVFLKAADLLAGPWRSTLNAATMLCQSKNAFQAEIDAACELIDFFRFNAAFAEKIYSDQPASSRGTWNYAQYRPLEGFVLAVTPFNFTSIAGNLPAAPALMGNTVVWKPASAAVYTAHFIMRLLQAAGLPAGVINMVAAPGRDVAEAALSHPDLAGIHFTGSTEVFQDMWSAVGKNIRRYRGYPRIVGETGGKDFIFAHPSAELEALVAACVRGAYEYQGQKCSAASRLYVPRSLWPKLKKRLIEEIASIRVGGVEDFRNFMNAVIDRAQFEKIRGIIQYAGASSDAAVVCGGECDDRRGYFIRPALIEAKVPRFKTMQEEIFGPVLTAFVYEDKRYEETLLLCDETSPYALTGAIFAGDRRAILTALRTLTYAAGNFYINDKPTGAVVDQQPFGGGRASGTNDKAGSYLNLLRWVTARSVKENFTPARDYRYPFMAEK